MRNFAVGKKERESCNLLSSFPLLALFSNTHRLSRFPVHGLPNGAICADTQLPDDLIAVLDRERKGGRKNELSQFRHWEGKKTKITEGMAVGAKKEERGERREQSQTPEWRPLAAPPTPVDGNRTTMVTKAYRSMACLLVASACLARYGTRRRTKDCAERGRGRKKNEKRRFESSLTLCRARAKTEREFLPADLLLLLPPSFFLP